MPATTTIRLRGLDLHHQMLGDGPPLVLVHGSWSDHSTWDPVVRALADRFRVVRYDRRGHSATTRPPGPVTRRDHEDDLAALVEALDCAPAHLVGNSYGGLIALGLAARRPELVRAVTVHEPPAMTADGVDGPAVGPARRAAAVMADVVELVNAGEDERGARRFVEEVALGPGGWEMLPADLRAVMVGNAPTFAAEHADRAGSEVDVEGLSRFSGELLITRGDASPPWLQLVAADLASRLTAAHTETIPGASHAPHRTHPAEYVELLTAWAAAAVRPQG